MLIDLFSPFNSIVAWFSICWYCMKCKLISLNKKLLDQLDWIGKSFSCEKDREAGVKFYSNILMMKLYKGKNRSVHQYSTWYCCLLYVSNNLCWIYFLLNGMRIYIIIPSIFMEHIACSHIPYFCHAKSYFLVLSLYFYIENTLLTFFFVCCYSK